MEIALRAVLIDHLTTDPQLSSDLAAITEEAPARASLPWLAIVASASADWSHKTGTGREVRLALELRYRGDDPANAASLVGSIESAVQALPAAHPDFTVITTRFLRARTEQRGPTTRATLFEYRFRLLAA